MRRRNFLALAPASILMAGTRSRPHAEMDACGCSFLPQAGPVGLEAFAGVSSGLKITGLKVFGVSLTPKSDRPYVFVKLETNQGLVGWGEGTLEGKAGAVMACINDFRDFVIGADPMQVEHTGPMFGSKRLNCLCGAFSTQTSTR